CCTSQRARPCASRSDWGSAASPKTRRAMGTEYCSRKSAAPCRGNARRNHRGRGMDARFCRLRRNVARCAARQVTASKKRRTLHHPPHRLVADIDVVFADEFELAVVAPTLRLPVLQE